MTDRGCRCPVCDAQVRDAGFVKQGHRVVRCAQCGLRFCPSADLATPLDELYDEQYFTGGSGGYLDYVGEEPAHRRQARRYLRLLERLGARPGRLLDVGCAAGFFLDEARRAGWAVAGCDVSAYASRYARERLGLDVRCGSFTAVDLPASQFDVVTAFNVFEHLPDPRAAAQRLARLVRPGGLLVLETWNCESLVARLFGRRWHQYAPTHVPFYYSREALQRLFAAGLWRLARYRPAVKWISLRRGCDILSQNVALDPIRGGFARLGRGPLGARELPYSAGDLVLAVFERQSSAGGVV